MQKIVNMDEMDAILDAVAEENNMDWTEVINGNKMREVRRRLKILFGFSSVKELDDCAEYYVWYRGMTDEIDWWND